MNVSSSRDNKYQNFPAIILLTKKIYYNIYGSISPSLQKPLNNLHHSSIYCVYWKLLLHLKCIYCHETLQYKVLNNHSCQTQTLTSTRHASIFCTTNFMFFNSIQYYSQKYTILYHLFPLSKPKTHDIHFIIIIKSILQPKDNTDKTKAIKIEIQTVKSTSFTRAMK